MVRKSPGPKTNVPDKRRRTMIAKRMYKVRVLTQPTPSTPTSTTPAPTVATVSTQTPTARSTAESVPVTVYTLATGQFAEVPHQTTRPQNEGSNSPPLEVIPNAPPRQGTPWLNSRSTSENLFETRKDWPIPPTPAATPAPNIKPEEPPQVAAIPHATVMPKQALEKCSWGLHFPICKNEEEHEEDWENEMQNQPWMHPQPQNNKYPETQNLQHPQAQNIHCPEMQNFQHLQLQKQPAII